MSPVALAQRPRPAKARASAGGTVIWQARSRACQMVPHGLGQVTTSQVQPPRRVQRLRLVMPVADVAAKGERLGKILSALVVAGQPAGRRLLAAAGCWVIVWRHIRPSVLVRAKRCQELTDLCCSLGLRAPREVVTNAAQELDTGIRERRRKLTACPDGDNRVVRVGQQQHRLTYVRKRGRQAGQFGNKRALWSGCLHLRQGRLPVAGHCCHHPRSGNDPPGDGQLIRRHAGRPTLSVLR